MAILAAAGGAVAVLGLARKGQAQTVYFDPNNPSSPSVTGGSTYSWNTSTSNWSTDPSGVTPGLVAWTNGANAVFVAGSNATGLTYTTSSGYNAGLVASSVTVNSGNLIITNTSGGGLYGYLTTSLFYVSNGASATWNGEINASSHTGFTKTGLGTLTLGTASGYQIPVAPSFLPGTGFSPTYAVNGGTLIGNNGNTSSLRYATIAIDSLNSSTFDLGTSSATTFMAAGLANGPNGGGVVTANNGSTTDGISLEPTNGRNPYFSGSIIKGSSDIQMQLEGLGTQTFAGSGNTTGGLSLVVGKMILDYTTNNAAKFGATEPLIVNNGTLEILGNGTASSTATFASLGMGSATYNFAGQAQVQVVSGAGQTTTVAIGSVTRHNPGAVDFLLQNTSGGTAIVTTTTPNSARGLLGKTTSSAYQAAWATLNNGADWAANSLGTTAGTGYLVPATYTQQDNAASWTQANISSSTNGFSGTLSTSTPSVNSLRFNAGGTANLGSSTTLDILTGGILVTPNVGTNSAALVGGILQTANDVNEVIVQQYNTASDFILGSQLTRGGTLTKAGPGTLDLTNPNNSTNGANTTLYVLAGDVAITANGALTSGGAYVNGGTLELRGVQFPSSTSPTITLNYDTNSHALSNAFAPLGALYASGGNDVYNGSINMNAYSGEWSNAIGVAAGSTLTVRSVGGSLNKVGAGTLIFNGAALSANIGNIYGGTVDITGSSTMPINAGSSAITLYYGSTLEFDNSATNVANRSNWYAAFFPGNFLDLGNTAGNSTGTTGQLGFYHGFYYGFGESTCEVQNGGTWLASVDWQYLNYAARSSFGYPTVLFRGNNLGANAVSNSSNIFFTVTPPTGSIGGGGIATNTGVLNASILPYALGQNGTAGAGNTFVSYNTSTGIYALATSGPGMNYDTSISSVGAAANNVMLAGAGDTVPSSKTINALLLNNTATSSQLISGAGTITISSGALLQAGSVNATITAPISFGNTEAVISVSGTGTLTLGSFNGVNASTVLTKSGPGTLYLNNSAGANISGPVNVSNGSLFVNANNAVGSGAVSVYYGGTLGGNVTSSAPLASLHALTGATVAPGTASGAVGNLYVGSGGLALDGGSTFSVNLTGSTPSQYSALYVSGPVNLYNDMISASGTYSNISNPNYNGAILNLNITPNGNMTIGSYYDIIHNSGGSAIANTFNGLVQGATFTDTVGSASYTFQIGYAGSYTNATTGSLTGGSDVVLNLINDNVPQSSLAVSTTNATSMKVLAGSSIAVNFSLSNTGNTGMDYTASGGYSSYAASNGVNLATSSSTNITATYSPSISTAGVILLTSTFTGSNTGTSTPATNSPVVLTNTASVFQSSLGAATASNSGSFRVMANQTASATFTFGNPLDINSGTYRASLQSVSLTGSGLNSISSLSSSIITAGTTGSATGIVSPIGTTGTALASSTLTYEDQQGSGISGVTTATNTVTSSITATVVTNRTLSGTMNLPTHVTQGQALSGVNLAVTSPNTPYLTNVTYNTNTASATITGAGGGTLTLASGTGTGTLFSNLTTGNVIQATDTRTLSGSFKGAVGNAATASVSLALSTGNSMLTGEGLAGESAHSVIVGGVTSTIVDPIAAVMSAADPNFNAGRGNVATIHMTETVGYFGQTTSLSGTNTAGNVAIDTTALADHNWTPPSIMFRFDPTIDNHSVNLTAVAADLSSLGYTFAIHDSTGTYGAGGDVTMLNENPKYDLAITLPTPPTEDMVNGDDVTFDFGNIPGVGGGNFDVYQVAVVPEPTGLSLLGLGALGLLARKRRRTSRR